MAPVAAAGILLAAQRVYKKMMEEERVPGYRGRRPSRRYRGGEGVSEEVAKAMKVLYDQMTEEQKSALMASAATVETAPVEPSVPEASSQPDAATQPSDEPEPIAEEKPNEEAPATGGARRRRSSTKKGGGDALMADGPTTLLGGASKKKTRRTLKGGEALADPAGEALPGLPPAEPGSPLQAGGGKGRAKGPLRLAAEASKKKLRAPKKVSGGEAAMVANQLAGIRGRLSKLL